MKGGDRITKRSAANCVRRLRGTINAVRRPHPREQALSFRPVGGVPGSTIVNNYGLWTHHVCSLLRLGAGHRGDDCEGNQYDIRSDVGNKED
jgi:hypothetical protein